MILASSILQILAMIVSFYANSYLNSNVIFQLFFAMGSGINIILCLQCLWEHNYRNRSITVGFVWGAYSLGYYIFGSASIYMMNPDHLKPNLEEIYPESVAMNVPKVVKIEIIIFSSLLLLGTCLIERVKRKIAITISKMDPNSSVISSRNSNL